MRSQHHYFEDSRFVVIKVIIFHRDDTLFGGLKFIWL